MKLIVQVPDLVLFEVNEAVIYYGDKQDGLGDKLYDDFEDVLIQIEKNPLSIKKYINYTGTLYSQNFPI
ncbi:MAG TPA: hypothetical protein VNZ49_04140 [Bacteroidia bacterium]|jgi:hypothetical protein|nr:hypothetical protein [Bacteroidia bacterium]